MLCLRACSMLFFNFGSTMRLTLLSLIFCTLLSACKKDKRVLESDVQPVTDAPGTGYTSLPVIAFTQKYDSILSFRISPRFLGCNNDAIFGKTQIGLYTNAVLNTS